MIKIPEGHQTRLKYALMLGLASNVFILIWAYIVAALKQSGLNHQLLLMGFGVIVFGVAFFIWPKHDRRTRSKMIGVGLKSMIVSYVFASILLSIVAISHSTNAFVQQNSLLVLVIAPFLFMFLFVVVTLGIPFIMTAVISAGFANDNGDGR